MDDPTDLIERLLVSAAGIMEDASTTLVLRDERSLAERIEIARNAAADVSALNAAAEVLRRHQVPARN